VSVTAALAREVTDTTFGDLPRPAVDRIIRLVADSVGLCFMGYQVTGRPLCDYAAELGGPEEAVLVADGRRVPAEVAAAVNAQVARDTDFEETGPGLHAGPAMVHTAIAVGQRVGASGADVLTAAILGYEINARFHHARRDGDVLRHHATCVAIVAGKLLGLDVETLNRAIGFSWDLPTSDLLRFWPPPTKRVSPLGIGNLWICRLGVQAALLARHGYGGLRDELDFHEADYDLDRLGSPTGFVHTANELELKPYPASRGCNGALHLVGRIVRRESIGVGEIERITARLPSIYLDPHQFEPEPENYWQAIYSTHWGITMQAMQIPPGRAWFTPDRLADRAARRLCARVEIVEDPEATRARNEKRRGDMANTVEVQARGEVFTESILMRDVPGSAGTPISEAGFEAKFLGLVEPGLGAERAAALYGTLMGLETVPDVRSIASMVA